MKLTIHAAPFYAPKKQDIVSETITESRILDRPERLGPYRSVEEFLSWFKNNEPTLDVITQYPEILNLVGEMINGRVWAGLKYSDPISVSVRHWCAEAPGPSRLIERIGKDKEQAIERWNMRSNAKFNGG